MDPDKLKAAMAALDEGDVEAARVLIEELMVAAEAAPAPDALEGEPTEAGAEGEPTEPAEPTEAAASEDDEEKTEAMTALSALREITGKAGAGEALEVVTAWSAAEEKRAADRAALELSSRRELIGELVQLGAETPATAWDGEPDDRNPCARLAAEPVEDMRTRVEALKAGDSRPKPAPKPAGGEEIKLSANEEKLAAAMTPKARAKYLALRATRER